MGWYENDTESEINPGMIIGITAGVIVFLGVVIVVIAKQSPPPSCFRAFDYYVRYLPILWFFVMTAAIMITATNSKVDSKLPIAVSGSCFLLWGAVVALAIWRVTVNHQAPQALGCDDGNVAVYAIAIDSGGHTRDFQHSGNRDVSSAKTCNDSRAFDGGNSLGSDDTGGAINSNTDGGGIKGY